MRQHAAGDSPTFLSRPEFLWRRFPWSFPAILQSRANAQRISCENRMQQTYAAIAGFADRHNGKLPGPEPRPGFESKAGIIGPLITQANFLKDHRALVCPSSDLATEDFEVPTLARASGRQRAGATAADSQHGRSVCICRRILGRNRQLSIP